MLSWLIMWIHSQLGREGEMRKRMDRTFFPSYEGGGLKQSQDSCFLCLVYHCSLWSWLGVGMFLFSQHALQHSFASHRGTVICLISLRYHPLFTPLSMFHLSLTPRVIKNKSRNKKPFAGCRDGGSITALKQVGVCDPESGLYPLCITYGARLFFQHSVVDAAGI